MHVSASIFVNTVAYGLGSGKQLIKKIIFIHVCNLFIFYADLLT